ncbi:MAG: MBL fold metallo-hydrolase [Terrimicrobiaceae bacterium]|nr:MBL fold metallo-hydrolase [Terrimicrobiaceae bacterium]
MKVGAELEITFLGTGTSQGVPMIACDCAVCHSSDPRDTRLRTAARVRTPKAEFVIDTPPDFRTQALRENLRRIDAVLYTHAHTDHVMGFDDLRRFCETQDMEMPIHATPAVIAEMRRIFSFAFDGSGVAFRNFIRPHVHEITGPFALGDLDVTSVQLPHGRFSTTGYIFSKDRRPLLAYFTDCNAVPQAAREAARGVEVLVIDALRPHPHPTHLSVSEAIEAARGMQAKRTFFTHMGHDLGHAQTEAGLPDGVRLAYDGLRVSVS